jgi:hypothetical protein
METADLEKIIADLVGRKEGLDLDGAEYAMLNRVLNGCATPMKRPVVSGKTSTPMAGTLLHPRLE